MCRLKNVFYSLLFENAALYIEETLVYSFLTNGFVLMEVSEVLSSGSCQQVIVDNSSFYCMQKYSGLVIGQSISGQSIFRSYKKRKFYGRS